MPQQGRGEQKRVARERQIKSFLSSYFLKLQSGMGDRKYLTINLHAYRSVFGTRTFHPNIRGIVLVLEK